MTTLLRRVMVILKGPVSLTGVDGPVPAGRYEVTIEEEPLGDVMYPAYRRTSSLIYLPQVPGRPGVSQLVELNASELDMLLAQAEQSP